MRRKEEKRRWKREGGGGKNNNKNGTVEKNIASRERNDPFPSSS